MVRAQLYGPDGKAFLKKGAWTARIERRLAGKDSLEVCFSVPTPGRYAIAVRHDANDNGHSDWSDGGGFSRDPDLSLFHLKPKFDDVAVAVGNKPVSITIVMQYRHGLSIKPLSD